MSGGLVARLFRFAGAGLLNTAAGATAIVVFLRLGWGDYLANVAGYLVGFALSYVLNSRWVFADKAVGSRAEMVRFGLCAGIAYAANLGVIYLRRLLGHIDDPVTHAIAVVIYSAVFFALSHLVVFRRSPTEV